MWEGRGGERDWVDGSWERLERDIIFYDLVIRGFKTATDELAIRIILELLVLSRNSIFFRSPLHQLNNWTPHSRSFSSLSLAYLYSFEDTIPTCRQLCFCSRNNWSLVKLNK